MMPYKTMLRLMCAAALVCFSSLSSLTIAAPPILVTPDLPSATYNKPYVGKLLVAAVPPLSALSLTGLPTGLFAATDLDGNISITGTPTVAGTFSVGLSARNADAAISPSLSLTVARYPLATGIAAGGESGCAIVGGGVQCWGRQPSMLGEFNSPQSLPHHIIAPGSDVIALAAHETGGCAIANGGVICWGGNYGAAAVHIIASGSGATSVAVSIGHACAVVREGVQCWGGNSSGQLGDGTTLASLFQTGEIPSPKQAIAANSDVVAVSVGVTHSCAVARGGVKCWGANTVGQLGNGAFSFNAHPTPIEVLPQNSGVSSIAAGYTHTCAVVAGGAKCWGSNRGGELGIGSTVDTNVPTQVFPAGSGVSTIAAGGTLIFTGRFSSGVFAHTCALVASRLKCWGDNSLQQLGSHPGASSTLPIDAEPAASGISAIALGGRHSCVLRAGVIECWGIPNINVGPVVGLAGLPTYTARPGVAIAAGSGAETVGTASWHSCSVIQGGVQCWGDNTNGQLGNGTTRASGPPVSALPIGSGATMVVTSSRNTCAIVRGGVQCWGFGGDGQLGNGARLNSSVPVVALPAGSGVTRIAVGFAQVCAVSAGGLRCWGSGSLGLFLGSAQPSASVNVPTDVIPVASGVSDIAIGSAHFCVVIAGGVNCWGSNGFGTVGDGSTITRTQPVNVIPPASAVSSITASANTTCVVVDSGVRCWGDNAYGQAGVLGVTPSPTPAIAPGSGVTQVSAGHTHTCALQNAGVTCWGSNSAGERGDGERIGVPDSRPVVVIPANSGVSHIATGDRTSCAVLARGVVCWGNNSAGQTGDAATYFGGGAVNVGLISAPPPPSRLTAISFITPPSSMPAGQAVNLSAFVSGIPSGILAYAQFRRNGVTIDGCGAVLFAPPTVQCSATFYETGDALITVEFLGTPTYARSNASMSGVQNVTVGTQSIQFDPISVPPFSLPLQISIRASVTSKLPVDIISLTPTICTVPTSPFGASPTSISVTSAGTCTIRASQGGNAHFTPAPAVERSFVAPQIPVPPQSQTITLQSNFTTVTLGAPPPTFTAFSSSGLPVTVFAETPGFCAVSGNTVLLLASGYCRIAATQAGNAAYFQAGQVGTGFEIHLPADRLALTVKAENQTTLGGANPAAFYGEIITLTAIVSGQNPGGIVSFSTFQFLPPIFGCIGIPVVNGRASCVVPSRYQTIPPAYFSVYYHGDVAHSAGLTSVQLNTDYNSPRIALSAAPTNPSIINSTVTLTALVRGPERTGTVSFHAAGFNPQTDAGLPGCAAKPVTKLAGTVNSFIATCEVSAPASGSTQVHAVYREPNAANLAYQASTTLSAATTTVLNYTDMWWGGTRENGWGVSIAQHGAQQFNVIFAYDNAGKPTWYVMPGCTWNAANTACTGALYSPTGAPFAAYDAARFAANASVGSATFTYKSSNTATLTFTINGVLGTKEIERQLFGAATTEPTLNVNDMWWNGPAEDGWGINIAQQGRQLFPVWYTYDANGKPTFYAVPGGTWNGLVFTGDMYTTTSSAWLGVAYDASKFVATKVGSMVIDFRDANTATITYTVGTVTQTKMIVRQAF